MINKCFLYFLNRCNIFWKYGFLHFYITLHISFKLVWFKNVFTFFSMNISKFLKIYFYAFFINRSGKPPDLSLYILLRPYLSNNSIIIKIYCLHLNLYEIYITWKTNPIVENKCRNRSSTIFWTQNSIRYTVLQQNFQICWDRIRKYNPLIILMLVSEHSILVFNYSFLRT